MCVFDFPKRFIPNYLSILAGILIGTSYIPFPPWASIFCFVPLWTAWLQINDRKQNLRTTLKSVFFTGWITQFVLTLIGFNWVTYTIHEFGKMPWPLAAIVFLLFCGIAHLYIPIAGLIWTLVVRKFSMSRSRQVLMLAILLSFFESKIFTIFPWNFGYTWYWANVPIYQWAELIGFQGLSTLTILANAGSFLIYDHWRQYKKMNYRTVTVLISLFVAFNLVGAYLPRRLLAPDQTVHVAIVQANIGNIEKEQQISHLFFQENIFKKHENLSLEALSARKDPTDITIWPETAYPYTLNTHRVNQGYRQITNLAQKLQSHIITGSYSHSLIDGKLTNSFFIISREGEILADPYYKSILLAFGEYIPFADYYPQMKNWIPAGDFSRGPGPTVKELPLLSQPGVNIKIGPQICYESLFPDFAIGLANLGAEVILNLTNDSWYGLWQEPYQHLYMTLARGIETRRPVIRSTNTGISAVSLADGTVLQKSPIDKAWFGHYSVPYKMNPLPTFFQEFPWLTNLLLIMSFLGLLIRRRPRIERP